MHLRFTYTFDTYDDYADIYSEYEYNFTPDEGEIEEAAKEYFAECVDESQVENFTEWFDYYAEEDDGFVDYAKDYFYDAAHDAFLSDTSFWEDVHDSEELRTDPYSYYGVSRSDFC